MFPVVCVCQDVTSPLSQIFFIFSSRKSSFFFPLPPKSATGAVGAASSTPEAMGAEGPAEATVDNGDMDAIDLPAAEKELPVRPHNPQIPRELTSLLCVSSFFLNRDPPHFWCTVE